MKRLRHFGVSMALFAPLAACTTSPIARAAPEFPSAEAVPALPEYRMQVGDVLLIKFYLTPDLTETVPVRPDGRISTALAQDVLAFGRTPAEVAAELKTVYARILTDPQLSVIVQTFAPNRVYVAGEVVSPGEFLTVGPNLTLTQAVARAGGVKFSASRHNVFIIRRGPGDVPEFLSTAYYSAITAGDPHADVRLAQYDVVYVPKTSVAEAYLFFNQYLQQFVPLDWNFTYAILK